MSGILLNVMEKLPKLFIVNCIFASIQVFSGSLFCVKYMVSDHALLYSYPDHH